jgi:hypothetical protein
MRKSPDIATRIDQAYSLFGMPKRVTGFIGKQRRGVVDGAPDSHTVLLHYEGPLLVTVKAGVVSPEVEQLRYWVRGTKGSFKKVSTSIRFNSCTRRLTTSPSSISTVKKTSYARKVSGLMTKALESTLKAITAP